MLTNRQPQGKTMQPVLSSINPWALPKVDITELRKLPAKPGVYFALFNDQLLYIGITSVSLKQRWARHHRHGDLSSVKGVQIAYLVSSCTFEQLQEIERGLISLLNPVLNNGPVFNKAQRQASAAVTPAARSAAITLGLWNGDMDDVEGLAMWAEEQRELDYFALGLYD
jgi:hypothetical protein